MKLNASIVFQSLSSVNAKHNTRSAWASPNFLTVYVGYALVLLAGYSTNPEMTPHIIMGRFDTESFKRSASKLVSYT